MTRLPGIESNFSKQISLFMQRIREVDFLKKPGVSESLDWAKALMIMHRDHLSETVVRETIGCILKYQEVIRLFKDKIWTEEKERRRYMNE